MPTNCNLIFTRDEAIVLAAYLRRELVERDGRHMAAGLVHASEAMALHILLDIVEAGLGASWRHGLAAARARLTPEETELPIAATGSEAALPSVDQTVAVPDGDSDQIGRAHV